MRDVRFKKEKTTEKTTDPVLVEQSHGGSLKSGGTPGNKGGTGRPPDEIRALCRKGFDEEGIDIILGIARNEASADDTRLKAVGLLGTHGLGTKTEITLNNEQALTRAVHILLKYTPEADHEAALSEMKQAFAE